MNIFKHNQWILYLKMLLEWKMYQGRRTKENISQSDKKI